MLDSYCSLIVFCHKHTYFNRCTHMTIKAMKKNFVLLLIFVLSYHYGCSKDDSSPTNSDAPSHGWVTWISSAKQPGGSLNIARTRSDGKTSEITYLTNSEPRWRIRFRKNPGFKLLSETYSDRPTTQGVRQRVSYVFDRGGGMSLYVDGKLLHSDRDPGTPYRSGYHGFRTWNSVLKLSNFRVYGILGS